MIIGSSHGVGGGPTQTEVLSTVVAQLEPIHALMHGGSQQKH